MTKRKITMDFDKDFLINAMSTDSNTKRPKKYLSYIYLYNNKNKKYKH